MKKISFLLTIVFSLLITNNKTFAVPAYPKPVIYTQPDQSVIVITLQGDEKVHWALSEDGYTLLRNREGFYEYARLDENEDLVPSGIRAKNIAERTTTDAALLQTTGKGLHYSARQVSMLKEFWQIEKTEREKVFPTTGSRRLVCILIGYTDLTFTKTQTDFQNLFNQVGYTTDGATGSVKDYYTEVSYNQFDLTVDIAGPYTASQNMAYYGANDAYGNDVRPRELVTEAVNLANPDVNYADYDNDNDGNVDAIYVIFAGYGEEAGASADAIWSHAWAISPITRDGKTISRYSCSPELRGNSGNYLTRIGVICHEFGHVLGAPDYYDTDYSSSGGNFTGTGNWDIMAHGSWNNNGATPAHHNAYTKTYIYNWAPVTVLSVPVTLTVYNSEDNSNSFYRYNTATTNEYYLMETRVQTGFDASIPGEGLLIYHVHSNIASALISNTINVGHPQMMYPVCASATTNPGSSPSSYGSINSAGCPFPGSSNKTSFTDATTPSAQSWAGANTNQPLTNIAFIGASDLVTLDFMGGDPTTGGDDCSDAINLVGESGTINYSTTGFNDDYAGSCGGTGEDRVYYLVTPVAHGDTLEIWTTSDDYDVVLYANYGTCTGIEIGCVNDPDGDPITWINSTGTDQNVWIFVDGNAGSDGSATLNWNIRRAVEPGEDCENPIIISGTSGSIAYSTIDHTNDFTSNCGGGSPELVFYLNTAIPDGSTINFWTSGDDYDVILYGRTGSCTGIEVACVDDPDGTVLSWENTTGSDQYIWIFTDGWNGSVGSATLNWEINEPVVIEGDDCSNAIVLSGTEGTRDYTTTGASHDYNGSCGVSGSEDLVFYLEDPVPAGDIINIYTTADNYNVVLYARYGSCTGTEIDCVDDPDGTVLSWENTTASDQYIWIFADGYGGSDGSATLHWEITEPSLPGEDCTNPDIVTGYSGEAAISTEGYIDEYDGSCGTPGPERVILLGTGIENENTLEIWTSDQDYDVVLYGRYGSCAGTEIGCSDEAQGPAIEWQNTTGSLKFIWIFIDGASGAEGNATLHWNITEPTAVSNFYSPVATIYPNPASESIQIGLTGNDQVEKIAIINSLGTMVSQLRTDALSSQIRVDLSAIPEGTYLVDIYTNKTIVREKLLIVR
jgi:M6 family metalloprotease-like protein